MKKDKVHRGRKTLTEQLRIHFDKRNFGAELEAIVSRGITDQTPLTTARAVNNLHTAINENRETGIIPVNAVNLRRTAQMLTRSLHCRGKSLVKPANMKRGPQTGSKPNSCHKAETVPA